ncbi:MAG: ATP-dependent Clp protease proteolytic subunit, partial [Chloroflexi bacterium]|nr:ATP-dependent Clp protease proteolytic subunit [Chloroflexota bacterium]
AAKEIRRLNEKIRRILAENTGQDFEKIVRDTDRDFYLDAIQAKEYGLVDDILTGQSSDGAKKDEKDKKDKK